MSQCYKLIQIPRFSDERGNLSVIELGQLLDFPVKRAYWLYDIKNPRGGHAHKQLQQFIFCAHGSIELTLDDGEHCESIRLDSPHLGLAIYKPTWREITHFTPDAAVIILASELYDESDYLRSYDEFKQWKFPSSI